MKKDEAWQDSAQMRKSKRNNNLKFTSAMMKGYSNFEG